MTDEDKAAMRKIAEDEMEKAFANGENDFSLEELAQRCAARTPAPILQRNMEDAIEQAVIAMRRTGGNVSFHDLLAAGMSKKMAHMLLVKEPEFFPRLEAFMVGRGELPSRKPS